MVPQSEVLSICIATPPNPSGQQTHPAGCWNKSTREAGAQPIRYPTLLASSFWMANPHLRLPLESSLSKPCPPPANTYLVTADLCGLGRYPPNLFTCPTTTAPRTRQTPQQWDEERTAATDPALTAGSLLGDCPHTCWAELSAYIPMSKITTKPCYQTHKSCCVNI